MAKAKLSDLTALLEIQRQASQTKLRQIKEREARLQAMLVHLYASKRDISAADGGSERTSLDFQNDLRHLQWVDQRRAAINIELAQVRALLDMAKQELAKHFARQQALEKVVEVQTADAATRKSRRATYGS